MASKHNIFSNLKLIDWLLVAVFILLLAVLGNLLLPNYGWLVGILAALGLLYIAKRKRDQMMDENKK